MTPEQKDLLRHWLDGGMLEWRRTEWRDGQWLRFDWSADSTSRDCDSPNIPAKGLEWRKAVPPSTWSAGLYLRGRDINVSSYVTAEATHKITITWPEGGEPTATIERVKP